MSPSAPPALGGGARAQRSRDRFGGDQHARSKTRVPLFIKPFTITSSNTLSTRALRSVWKRPLHNINKPIVQRVLQVNSLRNHLRLAGVRVFICWHALMDGRQSAALVPHVSRNRGNSALFGRCLLVPFA